MVSFKGETVVVMLTTGFVVRSVLLAVLSVELVCCVGDTVVVGVVSSSEIKLQVRGKG